MSARGGTGYIGQLIWTPLPDGIHMELVDKFGFRDKRGLDWMVPKGTRVDGASIPQALWSIVGSPFTGKYRDASVIHDFYCDTRIRPWREVHGVFYEAMIVSDVSEARAKLMYAAVYFAGPRWSNTVVHNSNLNRQFSILHTPFSKDVRTMIDADGITAEDSLVRGGQILQPDSPIHLHIDDFERLIRKYDPSINQISTAIDSSLDLFGSIYQEQRILSGVSELSSD
ncbi:DUF1353 domain-containing protein [Bradyrhizobium sp.]|jgi:hypothetical protein|uniref:DUF1353 domain-containing protein n=1 Tax=Bradyrhizobium sp. TaxID=376 RepID=UPI003C2214D6